MPSGRDLYTTKPFILPKLDGDTLIRMKAPPKSGPAQEGPLENDSSEDEAAISQNEVLPSTFPGTSNDGGDQYY